jgi:hypothetical protein
MFLVSGGVLNADGKRDYQGPDDKWFLSVGSYITDFKTDASVGAGGVFGAFFRAEDDLAVDENQAVLASSARYRFNKKHAIGGGIWSLNRDGSTIIEEDLEIDGVLYSAGAQVDTEFDTGLVRVDWRYSLFSTDRGEAGFLVGLSAYQFDLAFEGIGTLTSGGMGGSTEFFATEEEFLAPLPTVGFFLQYALGRSWLMRAEASWLDLEVGDLEGQVTQTHLSFEWLFTRRFALGGALNGGDISVRDTGDEPYVVDFDQSGFYVFLSFRP